MSSILALNHKFLDDSKSTSETKRSSFGFFRHYVTFFENFRVLSKGTPCCILYKFPPPHSDRCSLVFSSVGIVSLSVQVHSAVLFIVSFANSCSLKCDSADVMVVPPFLGVAFVLLSIRLSRCSVVTFIVTLTAPCCIPDKLVKREFSVLKLTVFYRIFS